MTGAALLLALVTAERLGELVLARRNTAGLLARGGVEIAPGHYPLVVALHAAWLAYLWTAGLNQPVQIGWLAVFGLLQILRAWVLLTLGSRWTTRILVVPGETLVASGPYRILPHPNYAVVIGEIAVLPLCLGLTGAAIVFSLLNAAVLTIRIRAENAALAELRRDGRV
ncbi:membrane protein [Alsobacter metallidurans]|uniref:Membrane protein n=1 Tax=Alsobacter metallidurans TaxID=340221 RepID=A0A917I8R7_9HYPH|nr:isoprenylcysteine carboxylmethyltransferase family protein [Alsobacter metallidurans]GGH20787.1 membrane protein [Alsobacter metallidurans]